MAEPHAATTYLSAAQVRSRYGGISDMTLWRWQRRTRNLSFPEPRWISGRRFWLEEDLARWDATHPVRPGRPAKAQTGAEAA